MSNQSAINPDPSKRMSPTYFPIFPLRKYDVNFPKFTEPKQVGCFSLDGTVEGDRNFYNDARKLKVYYPPRNPGSVDFNLMDGYDSFKRKNEDIKERLNNILKWILHNKKMIAVETDSTEKLKNLNADFIMWRGHLTKIACTPYNRNDSWAMAVCLFNGTYYMSEVETEENEIRRHEMTDRDTHMTYWGYKFEQYVTSEDLSCSPDTSLPVDNHDAFCIAMTTKLNNHSLLYCGEVDCRDPASSEHPPRNYIELKTSRIWFTDKNQRNFYRYKLIKWWAQSFLVGIPQVICGFRDDDGFVKNLQSFRTSQMPRDSKENWSGSVAFNFCDQFLTFVKSIVTISDPGVIYLFERRPDAQSITFRICRGQQDRFLPSWYTEQFCEVGDSS